jgi:alcohol dehydrogenase class IV
MATELRFGAGRLAELTDGLASCGVEKPLVVTGARSAKESGLLDRVLELAPGAEVYDGVEENPTDRQCDEAGAYCRERACDGVVALGGGSPMDAAKAVAVLARNDGPCRDCFGSQEYDNAPLPIIAIPTTAGTGSEVTPYAVLVNAAEGKKSTLKNPALFPRIALLDPELTVSMPREVTVSTGLDALSQAMEGMLSKKATPIGDALALQTVVLVARWLPQAADRPGDIEARAGMLYAATLSGMIIAQSGTTLVHGMGYYLTLEAGIPHGLANALLLAPVFQYNARFEPDKVATLSAGLGHPSVPAPGEAGESVSRALHGLFTKLSVSPAARDHGLDPAQVDAFAADIVKDPYRFRNQPGDPSQDEILEFYQCACDGRLLLG